MKNNLFGWVLAGLMGIGFAWASLRISSLETRLSVQEEELRSYKTDRSESSSERKRSQSTRKGKKGMEGTKG